MRMCTEEGVRQARLCTAILYENRLEKLAALSEADARVLFKNAPLFTLLRDPGARQLLFERAASDCT